MEYWSNRWKTQQYGWQLNKVNPNLIKYLPEPAAGIDPGAIKIFVPLCGQTHDLKYLVHVKGYSVFAVEGVESCIEGLNERDGFGLVQQGSSLGSGDNNANGKIYATPDQKLTIFIGNLFDCPIENWGPFDIIWDRASLAALEYKDRDLYLDVMKRSLRMPIMSNAPENYHNFHYILEVYAYDKNGGFPGPPRSVNEDDMERLFAPWTQFNLVHKEKLETKSEEIKKLGLHIDTCVYVLNHKC